MKFKKIVVTGLTEQELGKEYWARIDGLTDKKVFVDVKAGNNGLEKELRDADCLFTKFNPVTSDMFQIAKNLKYLGVFATGYGKIDSGSAASNNVTVTNVPGYSTESVAEFVFAVLLEKLRNLKIAAGQAKKGNYSESGFVASEIKSKKFGIIGLGRIGNRVADIANGFSADVKYWDRKKKDTNQQYEYMELDQLLSECDIITIHLALNDDTKGIISKEKLRKIKNGVIVVNTAPMELIDLDILIEMIKSKAFTFILDHSDEMDGNVLKELAKYENCIIYPPIAYISDEANIAKQEIFVSNIESFLSGKPINRVI